MLKATAVKSTASVESNSILTSVLTKMERLPQLASDSLIHQSVSKKISFVI